MRGQSGPSLLPVPVPSQVSRKTFIRAELGAPPETAPRGNLCTGTDKNDRHLPRVREGCWLGQCRGRLPGEQTRPPASGLLSPAGLSHWLSWRGGSGGGSSGRGCVCVCAPRATAASLHQDALLPLAGSAHWLAWLLRLLCPLPPRRPHPPGFTSFAVI